MMEKSLTYAYPQNYAFGGRVGKNPLAGRNFTIMRPTGTREDAIQTSPIAPPEDAGVEVTVPVEDAGGITYSGNPMAGRNFTIQQPTGTRAAAIQTSPKAPPENAGVEVFVPDDTVESNAPEGFEFVGMVDTKYGGPAKAFQKIGDDTGFTVYQREITTGKNKGKQGFFFDDIGDEVGSAGTGGYLNADDAFNQGRSRSVNYVSHYNTLIDRGVKLDDAAMEQLNAALAHHDKYLGGQKSYASNRSNILDAMNKVANYDLFSGGQYIIGDTGASVAPSPPPPEPELVPIEPGGDFGLPPFSPPPPAPTPPPAPYRREGVEFVEYNGQMVPKDALNALQGAVGLLGDDNSAEVMRYDVDGDGRVTAGDALAFLKYGSQEGYSDNADFFSNFYGSNTPPPPTVYEQGQGVADTGTAGQTLSFTPFNVFGGIDYTNPLTNTGTTVPTVNTPVVPTVNRTYGTYTPPDATQSLTGMGGNRTYGGFTGTGTPVTPPQSTFVQSAALDTSSVFDPVRQGLGSLFDRAKSLQGQSNYVNPFLRPGG